MTREFETRTLSLVVAPKGEPHFSEQATIIRLDSEGDGEFVRLEQIDQPEGSVAFDDDEWPHVRAAIDYMFGEAAKINTP